MNESKRYQVFVSSTYIDLKDERQAVISALLQLDAFPAGMELFPAADDDAWTLIERVIDDCDYYLLVIGGKYGSTDSEDELSYTEREYDYAVSKGKPVMAFLHAAPDSIPVGKTDKDPRAQEKLEAFKGKVKRSRHVKFWTSSDDLAGKVALSFAQFTRQYQAVGWVRADLQTSTETLLELNTLRKRVAELEYILATAQSGPPPGADSLAQGNESVATSARLRGEFRKSRPYTNKKIGVWVEVKAKWDEIFGAISGLLLDESEQSQLSERLNDWMLRQYWADNEAEVQLREKLQSTVPEADDFKLADVEMDISDDAFETILVQFMALGLIVRGTKRRSVNDAGVYWKLTPYGEKQTIQLRALTREIKEGDSDVE